MLVCFLRVISNGIRPCEEAQDYWLFDFLLVAVAGAGCSKWYSDTMAQIL